MTAIWNKMYYNISIIENSDTINLQDPNLQLIEVPDEHKNALSYYNGEFYYRRIFDSWESVKQERNMILQQTDYTQLLDYSKPDREKWAKYRQELRDLPNKFTKPEEAFFPLDPTIP